MINRYRLSLSKLFQHTCRNVSNKATKEKRRRVKIVEVGPRDGLQNEPTALLSSDQKIRFVQKLVAAGCQHIECGSFVSPKWVPAMANSDEVMSGLNRWRSESLSQNIRGTTFSVLTPNLQGFNNAINAGQRAIDEVAVFGAASETFSKKNIGCSIEESLVRFREVTDVASERGIPVRGYISCTLGCPYEKNVDPDRVAEVAGKLIEMGCHEISLGDTIGVGTPLSTIQMINNVKVSLFVYITITDIRYISLFFSTLALTFDCRL